MPSPASSALYLLDTDITSSLLDARRSVPALRGHFRNTPLDDLAISVITIDEMLGGKLDQIRSLQSRGKSVVAAYAELTLLYEQLRRFAVHPFSTEAERIYEGFPAHVKRIGVNDCRVAAIALAGRHTLVTANTRHFERVPGLVIADWTRE